MEDKLGTLDKLQDQINALRPFDKEHLEEVRQYYRVGLVYSSNALEGFTYTISETKVLLEDGLTAGGKPLRDAYAVSGHAKAYDHMFTLLRSSGLTLGDINMFHSLLEGSLDNQAVVGQYRTKPSFISGSGYAVSAPGSIQKEMDDLERFIKAGQGLMHPVEFAAQVHKQLVFIHPFADGNGRVARLVMNTLLIQHGYLPAIIPPILRSDYIAMLEKAHVDDSGFVRFIIEQEIETQKEMLRLMAGRT